MDLILLRVLIIAVVVPGLFVCTDRVEASSRAVRVYREAALCPVGTRWQTADDCVAEIMGHVAGANRSESCTTDSNGFSSCTTSYSVKVRFGQRTQWLNAGEDTYRAVRRGDPAELRVWRGHVVRMVAGGHTERALTSSEWVSAGWLVLGWTLLGAAWPAIFGLWLFPLLSGWLVLTVPYLMVAYNLLGLNPMGVTGWSIAGVLTAAGAWLMERGVRSAVDWA